MPRYKLTIEFDGTSFSGWQIQPDARTVEHVLEEAFQKKLRKKVDIVGQGRTDAGVHAAGQTAHVDLPDNMDINKLIHGVNNLCGAEIQIIQTEPAPDDFHARFDAISRQYEYTITTRGMPLRERYSWQLHQPVDISKLRTCAAMIKGEFDFSGFSKFNEDNFTTICDIQLSEFEIDGEVIRYHIRANRFLRNMVRRLAGTMIWVAQGKMVEKDVREALENPGSKVQTYTAPAKGLMLEKVFYKNQKKS